MRLDLVIVTNADLDPFKQSLALVNVTTALWVDIVVPLTLAMVASSRVLVLGYSITKQVQIVQMHANSVLLDHFR